MCRIIFADYVLSELFFLSCLSLYLPFHHHDAFLSVCVCVFLFGSIFGRDKIKNIICCVKQEGPLLRRTRVEWRALLDSSETHGFGEFGWRTESLQCNGLASRLLLLLQEPILAAAKLAAAAVAAAAIIVIVALEKPDQLLPPLFLFVSLNNTHSEHHTDKHWHKYDCTKGYAHDLYRRYKLAFKELAP